MVFVSFFFSILELIFTRGKNSEKGQHTPLKASLTVNTRQIYELVWLVKTQTWDKSAAFLQLLWWEEFMTLRSATSPMPTVWPDVMAHELRLRRPRWLPARSLRPDDVSNEGWGERHKMGSLPRHRVSSLHRSGVTVFSPGRRKSFSPFPNLYSPLTTRPLPIESK